MYNNVASTYKKYVIADNNQIITAQVMDSSGRPIGKPLQVTDGSIQFDYTSATRRSCSLTISDPTHTLVPMEETDELAPYGNRIKVMMGPDTGNTADLVPMGVYVLFSVSNDDQGTSFEVTLQGYDLSKQISVEALTSAYTIAAGTNFGTALMTLLNSRMSGIQYNFTPTSYTTPLTVLDVNQDPWAAAYQMAQAIGMDLYFDRNGICVMRPTPDNATAPNTWWYSDENDNGYGYMIDELQDTLAADNVYNHVIVSGETSGTTSTYFGEAKDTNPNSPTYINGPFGDRPTFYSSTVITSNAQAVDYATGRLRYFLGQAEQISILGPPNPAQDEQDVVHIKRTKDKVNDYYCIDKIQWALAPAGENTTDGQNAGQQTFTARHVTR